MYRSSIFVSTSSRNCSSPLHIYNNATTTPATPSKPGTDVGMAPLPVTPDAALAAALDAPPTITNVSIHHHTIPRKAEKTYQAH